MWLLIVLSALAFGTSPTTPSHPLPTAALRTGHRPGPGTPRRRAASLRPVRVAVSPARAGKHERFTVTITTRREAGVFGKTIRSYTSEAHAVHPAGVCVANRDRRFPDRPAGARARARLDPLRGEGGPEGWCKGLFRGKVTYFEGFACPPSGTCRPPIDFPTSTQVVARFTFRVR